MANPWGMSRDSADAWWLSDNDTGLSTLYDSAGAVQGLVVKIPTGNPMLKKTGSPTGTLYYGGPGFQVTPGNPSAFLFVTEDGNYLRLGRGTQCHHQGEHQGRIRLHGRRP